ncbi:serine/threonine-protein kinase [Megavirus baoshan]|uniref:cyclin-dependent kinase n=1 Tax=Megavirus baoshan TaxID=2496520 RepID=A0A3S8UYG3_9VIRU|nr:serine/threonine-protein kinase [Megavirus baoshan]AZL89763.1 serine/threonine-protein kinase [Megavirus baoshan]
MNYFDPELNKHDTITEKMRLILTDWLVEVSEEYNVSHIGLNLGIVLMDEFMARINFSIHRKKYQAIGIVCLNLASKIVDVNYINMAECMYISANTYSQSELLEFENLVLSTLNMHLYRITAVSYVNMIGIDNDINLSEHYLAEYIILCSLMKIDYVLMDQFVLAKKAIDLAIAINTDQNISIMISTDNQYAYLYQQLQLYNSKEWESISNLRKTYRISSIKLDQIFASTIVTEYQRPYNHRIEPLCINALVYNPDMIKNRFFIKTLGKGTFGTVDHVIINGQDVALKITTNMLGDNEIDSNMLREINNLYMIDHANITKLYGYGYYDNKLYLGMELMDTTLNQKLNTEKLSDYVKFNYIMQLLDGLKYLHEKNIMHRDLTCYNILISNDGRLKISDLGCARWFISSNLINNFSKNVCALSCRPIDIILGIDSYDKNIDIWSCACIIGSILRGSSLFSSDNIYDHIRIIFQTLGTPTSEYYPQVLKWSNFPKFMPVYPRKGFTDIDDKYPNQAKIIYKMLSYDPSERPDINEIHKMFTDSFIITNIE